MSLAASLLDTLPAAQRLALAYAPGSTRARLAGLLALDARLAGIVRNSREPMLAQLRLAWWREQLAESPVSGHRSDPLLEALECWAPDTEALCELVDGWEAMTGLAPLAQAAFERLADARVNGFAALAPSADSQDSICRMARNWALADMAGRLSHPEESATVRALAQAQDWTQQRLPRAFRPLAMLHALAARNLAAGAAPNTLGKGTALAMLRIGLMGR